MALFYLECNHLRFLAHKDSSAAFAGCGNSLS